MRKEFDISQFDKYREDNRREVKKANGGLPVSLWDTYSSFANCYGGVIILGIKEEKDGSWRTTGLQNESKLRKDFWDTINNPKKVNLNLLTDDDIETYTIGERKDVIMVIYVPMAKREQKPIYINNDIFNGTFRRNYEGDYHCTRLQVKAMLRDQTERTMDMEILDKVPMLWSSIFVTLVPNNFVFHTGLQMVSDNHYKNVVLHGCTKYTQILILLDSIHHHYGSNVNL